MIIELFCPHCNFSRKVPREKIPVGAKWATCPRCGQRFEFSQSEEGAGFITQEAEKTGHDSDSLIIDGGLLVEGDWNTFYQYKKSLQKNSPPEQQNE